MIRHHGRTFHELCLVAFLARFSNALARSEDYGALINGIILRTDQYRERLEQGFRVFDDLLEYFRRTVRRQPGQNQPS